MLHDCNPLPSYVRLCVDFVALLLFMQGLNFVFICILFSNFIFVHIM